MSEKLIESFCRSQISLVLDDSNKEYGVRLFGVTVPCKSKEGALEIINSFIKNAK